MKYLFTLSLFSLLFFSACEEPIDDVLPDNVFAEETDFVEITGHSYLSSIYKGKIEFTVNYDAISDVQRRRINRMYFQYDETLRFVDNLEQRSFVFPVIRGEEICIRFGLAAGTILSNPGPETCVVF